MRGKIKKIKNYISIGSENIKNRTALIPLVTYFSWVKSVMAGNGCQWNEEDDRRNA
jgi:hypothetical protein